MDTLTAYMRYCMHALQQFNKLKKGKSHKIGPQKDRFCCCVPDATALADRDKLLLHVDLDGDLIQLGEGDTLH